MKTTIHLISILFLDLVMSFTAFAQMSNCGSLSVKDGLSQSSVISIIKDEEGYMWFGTRDGANRYDGYDFYVLKHNPADSTSISDNYINCMATYRGGVWLGTSDGLNRYDSRNNHITRYKIGKGSSNDITSLLVLGEDLWIGTGAGLFLMQDGRIREIWMPDGGTPTPYHHIYCINEHGGRILIGHDKGMDMINGGTTSRIFSNDAVNEIDQDNKGRIFFSCFGKSTLHEMNGEEVVIHKIISMPYQKHEILIKCIVPIDEDHLLIGMVDGLHVFDKNTGSVTSKNYMLTHMSVESTYIDDSGTIWVGTYAGGIDYEHTEPPIFSFYPSNDGTNDYGVLGKIVYDNCNNCLWIGSDISGLLRFDLKARNFQNFLRNGSKGQVGINNNVKSICMNSGMLYAGFYNGSLGVFNPRKQQWTAEMMMTEPKAIYAIKWDDKGNCIMATYSDNGIKTLKDGQIQDLYSPKESSWSQAVTHLTDIEICGDTTIVGTRSNGIFLFKKDLELTHLSIDSEPAIAGTRISQIYKDRRGRILIGTFDGGLSIFEGKDIKNLTVDNGLSSNSVCSIIEDESGDIWVACRAGISHLDADDNVVMTYDHEYGIKAQEFSPNSIAKSPDGTIWVGGIDGLISFKPADIKVNQHIPPVAITAVRINDTQIQTVEGETLVLKHDENNISFNFSALNFIYPGKNQYSYKLEGSDHGWTEARDNSSVGYNDLRPGRYTFMVKGSNNDGIWNPDPKTFKFRIKPAPWNSWWAWAIYFLIAGFITSLIIRTKKDQRKMAEEVKMKTDEVEESRRRIAMYTNITHDIRTPLSLIISPLEDLISSSEQNQELRKGLISIHANAERMHRIVDQMMDLRCQEEGTATLKASEGDVRGFVEEIYVAFKYDAEKRHISYSFNSEERPLMIWYDRGQFEKVIMNILGNAFKFTPDGGQVSISVSDDDKHVSIAIKDSGIGISKDDQKKIFAPFYRASTKGYYEGSGIGLSVASNIIKQHGGEIYVDSVPDHGTTFTIKMLKGRDHLKDSEVIKEYKSSEKIERYLEQSDEELEDITPNKHNTVLVVEDNSELRQYIVHSLAKYWKVLEAANGVEGYSMAISYMPAVIVSDIMMPVMDGLEMCTKIKGNPSLSHIHVILLTARALTVQLKEGLDSGADDYILKPFSMNLLTTKIRNILSSRNSLKTLFGGTLSVENLGVKIDVEKADEKFLQDLNSSLLNYITDHQLDIDKLCRAVGMSKATLNRRIQSATGISTARYIKHVRLTLSQKLLAETDMSITEIASEVGFSSIGHFSNSFKEAFGMSPKTFSTMKGKMTP